MAVFAIGLSFCVGIVTQIKSIPQQTVNQTSVPKEQLSKVYTSLGAIGTGIFLCWLLANGNVN